MPFSTAVTLYRMTVEVDSGWWSTDFCTARFGIQLTNCWHYELQSL